ncbi:MULTISPECIES: DUF4148 domain-containing protein [Paraburkholderia]|uniref:DUF4148 domain-containing protein n=1 Tax=Paraburkholderia TaxID=1822464 RepID=UPI0022512DD4|nr:MULTISPECIES: DUF4148 domain-containing protein [Paraburkholderia]MCX4161769.1 DUF4148 domain-containing protein [Paraburkholderia megapolitana]MDN7157266.1 DUF4148 domain-containing protein [Paraburkholderia sp. CHISQ3]MDQ6494311.1 DUF4148 domain-containing protein [Paraburkholderia megapolitana]
MKSITTLILASALLFSTAAVQAQGLTRAEVKQQLIEAQANGLGYVTDASYPAVHPIYEHRVKAQAAKSSYGGVPAGSQQAGEKPHGLPMPHGNPHCVGPVSFCNIYFGS